MAMTLIDSYLKPKNVSRVSTSTSAVSPTTMFLLVEQPGSAKEAKAVAKPIAETARKRRRVSGEAGPAAVGASARRAAPREGKVPQSLLGVCVKSPSFAKRHLPDMVAQNCPPRTQNTTACDRHACDSSLS